MMQKLIHSFEVMKLYEEIGAIGLNYELYVEQEKFLLKEAILKKDISDTFDSISTTFQINDRDSNASINITINEDMLINNTKSLMFSINTNIVVNGKKDIENAFKNKEKYLKKAEESIKKILNK